MTVMKVHSNSRGKELTERQAIGNAHHHQNRKAFTWIVPEDALSHNPREFKGIED